MIKMKLLGLTTFAALLGVSSVQDAFAQNSFSFSDAITILSTGPAYTGTPITFQDTLTITAEGPDPWSYFGAGPEWNMGDGSLLYSGVSSFPCCTISFDVTYTYETSGDYTVSLIEPAVVGFYNQAYPCYCIVGIDEQSSVPSATTAIDIEPTPLPATLPLFAAGLGAMGLLGWRRKRKAAAQFAA